MKKLFKKLAGLMMGLLVVAGLAGVGANNDAPVKAEAAGAQKWSIIGSVLGSNWNKDHALTYNSSTSRYEITAKLNKNEAFKFRLNNAWTYQIGAGGTQFNKTYFSGSNGNDIVVAKTANYLLWIKDDNVQNYTDKSYGWGAEEIVEVVDQTYKVTYLDENNEVYVQKEIGIFEEIDYTFTDKTYSLNKWVLEDGSAIPDKLTGDITVKPTKVYTWSLCGTVSGGNWDNAVPLYYDAESDSFISEELILNANEEFKIRKVESWTDSLGMTACSGDKTLVSGSDNVKIKKTSTYVITLKGSKWTIAEIVGEQSFIVNYYNDANGEPIKTIEVYEGGIAPLDFIEQENNKFLGWYLDAGLTQACTTAPTVTGDLNLYGKYVPCTDYTIYVKATKALNVYAWNSVNSVNNGAWPGVAATLVTEGIYAYKVEAEYGFDKVIFNDGTGQTADLSLTASVYTVAEDLKNITTAPATQVVAHIENDSFDLAEVIPALGLAEGTVTYTATSVGYSLITLKEGTLVFDSAAHIAKEDKQPALEAYIAGVNTCTDYTNVNAYKALAAGLDTTATVADVDYDWDGTREGSTYVIDSANAWESDFLVTEDANAEGHFSISADFKAQIGYPNTEERLYGFVFYWDDANWITVYAKYHADRPTRMLEVQVVGCVGGHDPEHWTRWNTYWMCDDHHLYGQGIEADPAKGFTLSVEYNNGKFIPSVDGFVNASYDSTGKGGWTSVCDLASRFPSDIWTKECKVGYFVKAGANNLVTVSDIEVSSLDGETVDTVHNYYKVKASTNNVTITEYVDVQVSIQDKLDYMEALAAEQAEEETGVNTVTSVNNKSKGITVMLIVGIVALTSVAAYYFLGKKRFAR